MSAWDVIVIGAGLNGLTCAAALARRGRRPLVLEARDEVGGGAATMALAPGFLVPRLAHATAPLARGLVALLRDAGSEVAFVRTPVVMTGLSLDGPPLVVYEDAERTAAELAGRSARDGEAWRPFVRSREAIAAVFASSFDAPPPALDAPTARDAWRLLATARRFRALPDAEQQRLLRWAPMAVADLVGECFTDPLLQATVAADGILGSPLGPRSAGSAMQMLWLAAQDRAGDAGTRYVRGGPGRLAAALAGIVRAAGGTVRTGARAERLLVHRDRITGVALATGETIACPTVVSALHPRRTLLDLCADADLPRELLWRARHYRSRGVLAKVNLALSSRPVFPGVSDEALTGRLRIGPTLDYLERAFDCAKYGRWSPAPWIELVIPSLLDPSLAPPGAHVLSAYVQFAPYDLRDRGWDDERDALHAAAVDTIERYAPGLRGAIVAAEILTPRDLERGWGFAGGHIFHGELALDQLWAMRPLFGCAGYRGPIGGLFLCGAGTHPGGGLSGQAGLNAADAVARAG